MRVLIWSELFWPHIGGAEIFAVRLCQALQERGHDLVVATTHQDPRLPAYEVHRGIGIHRFPFWAVLARHDLEEVARLQRRISELKREFEPDLVHAVSAAASAFFELQTRDNPPLPLLMRLYNQMDYLKHPNGIMARLCLRADRIQCVSKATAERFCALLPELKDRCSVVYGGFEPPSRRVRPPDSGEARLVCVGRLDPVKGFDVALAALAILAPRFPGAELTIVGDGPERESLKARARELGVADRTRFTGFVAPGRVCEPIEAASLALIPSRSEGLPNVAIQAAFLGRPIVGTDVGGLPEAVVDGETGRLVPPDDPAALAAAVAELLGDPERARAMGRAARRRAEELFDWGRCVDAHEALYRQVAGG